MLETIRELVVRVATQNSTWGYTRIPTSLPTDGTLSELASFPDRRLRILNAENCVLTMMESLDPVLAHYSHHSHKLLSAREDDDVTATRTRDAWSSGGAAGDHLNASPIPPEPSSERTP